jgi:hypothetical protein
LNCFELLRRVLDDAYSEIPADSGRERDALISTELRRLSTTYKDLREYKGVDYSNPVTRFAYVYAYVTSHANIVYQLVQRSAALRRLLKQERIQVTCIGGGPGSDLLGLIKYLESRDQQITVTCNIYDRETAWGETWAGLFEKVDSDEVKVLHAFNSFDVTDADSYLKFRKYLSSDLFTMIYFMSEVYGLKREANPYFAHLMDNAKAGALFLFVDNSRSGSTTGFSDWFDKLAAAHGLEILEGDSERIGMPYEEEKRELGEYYQKFRDPKLTADVAWRVARKK